MWPVLIARIRHTDRCGLAAPRERTVPSPPSTSARSISLWNRRHAGICSQGPGDVGRDLANNQPP